MYYFFIQENELFPYELEVGEDGAEEQRMKHIQNLSDIFFNQKKSIGLVLMVTKQVEGCDPVGGEIDILVDPNGYKNGHFNPMHFDILGSRCEDVPEAEKIIYGSEAIKTIEDFLRILDLAR